MLHSPRLIPAHKPSCLSPLRMAMTWTGETPPTSPMLAPSWASSVLPEPTFRMMMCCLLLLLCVSAVSVPRVPAPFLSMTCWSWLVSWTLVGVPTVMACVFHWLTQHSPYQPGSLRWPGTLTRLTCWSQLNTAGTWALSATQRRKMHSATTQVRPTTLLTLRNMCPKNYGMVPWSARLFLPPSESPVPPLAQSPSRSQRPGAPSLTVHSERAGSAKASMAGYPSSSTAATPSSCASLALQTLWPPSPKPGQPSPMSRLWGSKWTCQDITGTSLWTQDSPSFWESDGMGTSTWTSSTHSGTEVQWEHPKECLRPWGGSTGPGSPRTACPSTLVWPAAAPPSATAETTRRLLRR